MKRLLLLCTVIGFSVTLSAQKTSSKKLRQSKSVKASWSKGVSIYAGLTQVGNNSWYTTGSDKFTMSALGNLDAHLTGTWKNKIWSNNLGVAYGLLNTTKGGVTKLNDRLEFSTSLLVTPKTWKKWSWGPFVQVRTQITDGYFYNYMGELGTKRRRSGFFAPAYIYLSPLGLGYKPCKDISLYVSPLVARWTVITNQPYSYLGQGGVYKGNAESSLASLYNVSPVKQHKGEFGLFARLDMHKEIMKNISYSAKLEMYGNYVKDYPGLISSRFVNLDWYMTNQLEFHVNKYIKVHYNLDMLYDDDMKQPSFNAIQLPNHSVGLQMLSTLGVGLKLSK
jgi:hypothetical protein